MIQDNALVNTSGEGKQAVIPDGVKRWSWGAFFLNWIWGVGNRTYVALLCLIPYLGIIMWFVLGFKGREWAWRNKHWKDVDEFERVQRLWSQWAVGIIVGVAIAGFLAALIIPEFAHRAGRR